MLTNSQDISRIFYDSVIQNNLSENYYRKILTHDLVLKQNFTNIMQIPRLDKIILNTTSKNYSNEKKNILFTLAALELISGQKPQLTYAKKSLANFKIREHQILGCKVVLRKTLMYAFLDKLSKVILPRIRDTIKKSLNTANSVESQKQTKKSNQLITYNFGIKNLMIFPELENHFEFIENFKGMNLCFVLRTPFLKKKKNFISSHKVYFNQNLKSANFLLVLSGFQIPIL